jgi:hypothetical protein
MMGMGGPNAGPAISADAVTQAASVLSGAQLQILQQIQQEQAAERQIAQMMRDSFRGARSGGTSSPGATTASGTSGGSAAPPHP